MNPSVHTAWRTDAARLLRLQLERPYFVAHCILLGLSCVLAFIPLFDLLGFEFSVAIAAALTLVLGPVTFAGLAPSRGDLGGASRPVQGPARTFVRLATLNLVLLGPPLVIITLNALRVRVCDYPGGLALYGLLPGVTAVYCTLTAMASHAVTAGRRKSRHAVYYGMVVLSVAGTAAHLALEPPIVAVNPYLGYFAGSIYDEALAVPPALLAYRVLQLALIAALVLGLEIAHRVRQRLPFPLGLRTTCAVLALGTVIGVAHHTELGFSINRGNIQEELGARVETEHFVIYYPADIEWRGRIDELADDHEFRYWQLSRFFESDPGRIHSYLYPNRDVKGWLMGAKRTLVAKLWLGEVHLFVESAGESLLAHELAHVFTAPFGSGPLSLSTSLWVLPNMGWVEGAATAAEWGGGELTPHGWSAAMIRLDLAPDIEAILGAEGFWTRHSRTVYTLMGSFCRWLIEARGIDRFKEAYRHGDVEAAYGVPIVELVAEWRAFLDTVDVSDDDLALAEYLFDRPSIFGKVCARNIAERKDEIHRLSSSGRFDAAVDAMADVVEMDPTAPQHRHELLGLLTRAERYGDAETVAKELLALDGLGAVRRAEVTEALGDVYWRRGDLEDALLTYEGLLEVGLPNAGRRALEVKIAALTDPQIRDIIRHYFFDEVSAASKLAALMAARRHHAESALLAYLIGLRMHGMREYAGAAAEMRLVIGSGLDAPTVIENARFVLGESLYFDGELEEAERVFMPLTKEARREGWRAQASDWLERVRWKQGREKPSTEVEPTRRNKSRRAEAGGRRKHSPATGGGTARPCPSSASLDAEF